MPPRRLKPLVSGLAALLFSCLALAAADDSHRPPPDRPPPEAGPPGPRLLPRETWPRLELLDGRVLREARASAEDARSVTFAHAEGLTQVDKRLLPEHLAEVFAFDPQAAAREARAQAAQRAAASAYTRARREAPPPRPARAETPAATPAPATPAPPPSVDPRTLEEIERAVQARARRYFEAEKRLGSGATLVFGLVSELEEPEPVSGWLHRWEVRGVAAFRIYDSIGRGSFSARTQQFRALVEARPGQRARVLHFEER